MTGPDADGKDHGADLVSTAVSAPVDIDVAQVSRKTKFSPWHLPRKQLCRFDQWLYAVDALRRELYGPRDPGHNFWYLSLPGDDLLDVRVLTRAFKGAGGPRLAFLGFNTMGGGVRTSESNLSLSEMRAHPAVSEAGTAIIDRKIEEVADEKSVGFRAFRERAPFDVINLDLTGTVVDDRPLTAGSVFQAVNNMFHEQANRRREPWLLFLTTQIGRPPLIDEHALRQLHAPLLLNSKEEEFRARMGEVLGIPDNLTTTDFDGLELLEHEPFARIVSLALSKWLVGLTVNRPDRWKLSLLSLYVYRVHESTPDMFSFVYRFDPTETHSIDATGLTVPLRGVRPPASELDVALSLLDAMRGVRDIDLALAADPPLLEEATGLTEKMLEAARYDVTGYRDWARTAMSVHSPTVPPAVAEPHR